MGRKGETLRSVRSQALRSLTAAVAVTVFVALRGVAFLTNGTCVRIDVKSTQPFASVWNSTSNQALADDDLYLPAATSGRRCALASELSESNFLLSSSSLLLMCVISKSLGLW